MSDTLADLMRKISGGGWDGFDEEALAKMQTKELRAEQNAVRAEAEIVRRALANPAGEAFLQWLLKKTLLRPPGSVEQAPTTAEMYAIAKAKREGQNAVLFTILEALAVTGGSAVVSAGNKSRRAK